MILRSPLLVAAALVHLALAYVVTSYVEVTLSPFLTYTRTDTTSTAFLTKTVQVSPTGTAAPTVLSAHTTILPTGRVTAVTAELSPGAGSPIDTSTNPPRSQYFVAVTYSRCFTSRAGDGGSQSVAAVTKLASLSLPHELTGWLTPTAVSTDYTAYSTTTFTTVQWVVNPADLDPIDLAYASYQAQPTRSPACTRDTSSVDYRGVCSASGSIASRLTATASSSGSVPFAAGSATVGSTSSRSSSSSAAVAAAASTSISCGAMNPCCYGCHGWGWGFVVVTSTDFYICEDGRQLSLNGSEMPPQPWGQNAGGRSAEVSIVVMTVASLLGVVMVMMM